MRVGGMGLFGMTMTDMLRVRVEADPAVSPLGKRGVPKANRMIPGFMYPVTSARAFLTEGSSSERPFQSQFQLFMANPRIFGENG